MSQKLKWTRLTSRTRDLLLLLFNPEISGTGLEEEERFRIDKKRIEILGPNIAKENLSKPLAFTMRDNTAIMKSYIPDFYSVNCRYLSSFGTFLFYYFNKEYDNNTGKLVDTDDETNFRLPIIDIWGINFQRSTEYEIKHKIDTSKFSIFEFRFLLFFNADAGYSVWGAILIKIPIKFESILSEFLEKNKKYIVG